MNTFDLAKHPLFTAHRDAVSGVVSYVLTPSGHAQRIAPIQQNFYFTCPSVSPDSKWLWFTCAFPPNPTRTLAVMSLDPANPIIRHFPGAAENLAHPMVGPDSRTCYFGTGPSVWRVDVEGKIEEVFRLPASYVRSRQIFRLATHLTMSADGRYLLLDGQVGDTYFVGTADLTKGPHDVDNFRLIKEFVLNHNHAQFHPLDASLFLMSHDHTTIAASGMYFHHNVRTVLMDTRDSRYDLVTTHRYNKHMVGPSHEWWSADGWLCYVDYQHGVFEISPEKLKRVHEIAAKDLAENVWPGEACHAHCNPDRTLWVADESPYKWQEKPCEVRFFNRKTGKVTLIASALPLPAVRATTPGKGYHIDPHPQFSPRGDWVIYTTTVLNGVPDVALVPVASLV